MYEFYSRAQIIESHEDYLAKRKLPAWDEGCKNDKERVARILEERNRYKTVPPKDRLNSTFVCNIHP